MRREFSRMTPRTRKITSTAYRRHDVDRRRRVLARCRQHAAESRTPSRPRPRTFLAYDSPPPSAKTRPAPRSRGTPDLHLGSFRRPCAGGHPARTFLQSELSGSSVGGCSCDRHLWRSRSRILQGGRLRSNTSVSITASQTGSFMSRGRRSAGAECGWNQVSRSGARTYRATESSAQSRPGPPTPVSAGTVPNTSADCVREGPGRRYRSRSFRYSRLHRRTIDAIVPEELRRLPQRWADRAAQQIDPSSSTSQ